MIGFEIICGLVLLGMMWLFANYKPYDCPNYEDEEPCDDPVILKCVEDVKNKIRKDLQKSN